MAQALLNFLVSPSSFSFPETLIHSHSLHILKTPSLNSRRYLLVKRIQCSASSDGGKILRTCKNCKTQFDPLLNHPRACRFHTAHFGGETKRKFESVYTGGTMDTPNSGEVLQYWHCCGSEDPFDSDPKVESHNKDDICESRFVQCRICHDEDEDFNMDSPCSCSGTLKFAHRDCVQRWCNEKGDTICEICHQQYKPGYTAPQQLFHYTGISMNFSVRRDWGLDLRNPYFLSWDVADDHELYSFHSPTSLICCRVVAFLFILLLFLRHSLPVFLGGTDDFSLTLLTVPLLRTLGILLVAYFFIKAFTVIQRCRQERIMIHSGFSSGEETVQPLGY